MKCELKKITPAMAARILADKNNKNRPLNLKHANALAAEMSNGRWKVNGDTICMNGSRLIDGQHRLKAIVLSGETIETLVVEGLDSDVFDTKDVGKRRSAGDTLSVRGEQNANRLAAALVMINAYCTARPGSRETVTNVEMEELLEKYPDARKSAGCYKKQLSGLLVPSVVSACHYLFSQKDPNLADEFIEKVSTGAGLEEGSPWLALRERLVSNSISKAKLDKWHLMALCIKAFNAARKGDKIGQLKWITGAQKSEPFPVVR